MKYIFDYICQKVRFIFNLFFDFSKLPKHVVDLLSFICVNSKPNVSIHTYTQSNGNVGSKYCNRSFNFVDSSAEKIIVVQIICLIFEFVQHKIWTRCYPYKVFCFPNHCSYYAF